MRHLRAIAATLFLLAFSAPALAQGPTPLSVVSTRQYGDGVNRVFEFGIANSGERPVAARGRLVIINVYAATLPVTIAVPEIVIPPGGSTKASVIWEDAPLLGQVRTLLVLNDGQHASLVESYTFWIVPYLEAAAFLAIAALLIALVLGFMRLPKYLKTRVPANMMPYVVEFDDTVVTLAARFDVTWQDIVRANRLKPPYALNPGGRVLIPKHGLRRPGPETQA